MTSTKTLDFQFGPKHIEYMRRCRDHTINVAEGAVRAGKTVDNVFAFSDELERTPDKIHLATGSTSANAKLNIGDCNGYGLEGIFRGRCHWGKYKGNEALFVRTPTGQKVIIFAGGAKADSFKKIRGNSYGMWIATEINLHHDNTIKEAFNRQLAAKHRKVFWDLNPDHPNAPIYTQYIDLYQKKQETGQFPPGYNYEHFTITDNKTLSLERIQDIISQYDPTSIWYLRDIEGKRCVAEGLIYDMFDSAKNVATSIDRPYTAYYVSMDYGTQNPTAMLLWGKYNGTWYVVDEYYYSGREKKKQKTDEEYYIDLEAFIKERPVKAIIIDPSAASMIACIRKHNKYQVKAADNTVLDGIRNTATALKTQSILICDCCENTLREIESYVWDEKASAQGEDKPLKENDHAMDAMRYFCQTVLQKGKIRAIDRYRLGIG